MENKEFFKNIPSAKEEQNEQETIFKLGDSLKKEQVDIYQLPPLVRQAVIDGHELRIPITYKQHFHTNPDTDFQTITPGKSKEDEDEDEYEKMIRAEQRQSKRISLTNKGTFRLLNIDNLINRLKNEIITNQEPKEKYDPIYNSLNFINDVLNTATPTIVAERNIKNKGDDIYGYNFFLKFDLPPEASGHLFIEAVKKYQNQQTKQ